MCHGQEEVKLKSIEWSNFPLPLIQVNPPDLDAINSQIKVAYEKGVFSNSGELQRIASAQMARQVGQGLNGYLASSNTAALTACLLEINVRGRYVAVSNFTFAATAHAVINAGGIPIICDIDENSLEIDFRNVQRIILSGTYDIAAVVPTRVFGFIGDMSELITFCNQQQIPVVIDAAACFPDQEHIWSFQVKPKYEVFSLHATKVFGIGEGGLIVGSPESIENVRERANFGILTDGSLEYRDGLNAKADEFMAARVLARLPGYSNDVSIRNNFVKIYKEIFSLDSRIRVINERTAVIYSYFPVIFETEEALLAFREMVGKFLTTRRYYFPTILSGYKGDAKLIFDENLLISESISRRILCLPVYVSCTDEVKLEIAKLLRRSLDGLK